MMWLLLLLLVPVCLADKRVERTYVQPPVIPAVPVKPCTVTHWSGWSKCSQSCSPGGWRFRDRTIFQQPSNGGQQCPALREWQGCNVAVPCPAPVIAYIPAVPPPPPPKNCVVGDWLGWTACSHSCGAVGRRNRNREIIAGPENGGAPCPPLKESEPCNRKACPQPCPWEWSAWSPCSTTCGEGRRVRTPHLETDGVCISTDVKLPADESELCQNRDECGPAADPCKLSTWTEWGACSATCGQGERKRHRHLLTAEDECPNGAEFNFDETEFCSAQQADCPSPFEPTCDYENWESWTPCDASCLRTRKRGLINENVVNTEHLCRAQTKETEVCTPPPGVRSQCQQPDKCIDRWIKSCPAEFCDPFGELCNDFASTFQFYCSNILNSPGGSQKDLFVPCWVYSRSCPLNGFSTAAPPVPTADDTARFYNLGQLCAVARVCHPEYCSAGPVGAFTPFCNKYQDVCLAPVLVSGVPPGQLPETPYTHTHVVAELPPVPVQTLPEVPVAPSLPQVPLAPNLPEVPLAPNLPEVPVGLNLPEVPVGLNLPQVPLANLPDVPAFPANLPEVPAIQGFLPQVPFDNVPLLPLRHLRASKAKSAK